MKLKELAIEGYGGQGNLYLGMISDRFSIVYGENGAGKTLVSRFLKGTLLGFDKSQIPSDHSFAGGRVNVTLGDSEFELVRGFHPTSPLELRAVTPHAAAGDQQSILDFPIKTNSEVYDTVFNVSFRNTPTNIFQLAAVLQNHLGTPSGPAAAGDDSEFVNWQRKSNALQECLESTKARIDSLNVEKTNTLSQIESAHQSRQSDLASLEFQISQLANRLGEIQASPGHAQLTMIEQEIALTRQAIESEQAKQESIVQNSLPVAQHAAIYQQLDEIEFQIRSWRTLQSEIQNQRIGLRDEMMNWNHLTLDSNDHPYHQARAILVALESKVDEAERNASHWSDASGPRVDTSQLTRSLTRICHGMRDDLYGLCNELANQYKHIRHKSAAAELKRLRRCYSDIGNSIERLIQRRAVAIDEIRNVDPLGADAIARAEIKFCQFAKHEGYLEARKQFLGHSTLAPATSAPAELRAPHLDAELARLADLERQRSEQHTALAQLNLEYRELHNQHADLTRQRDHELTQINSHELTLKIPPIDAELQRLEKELLVLRERSEQEREFVPTPPHSLLQRASELLSNVSQGDLTQIFLGDPTATSTHEFQIETQVRERFGKVLNFSAIEPGLQDQVYLCLILAAKEYLKLKGIEAPTLLDDAFLRIAPERVTATLTLLNDFSASGHQIIALTQHRYLADRLPGIPMIELTPTLPTTQPLSTPDRQPSPIPTVFPPRESDWSQNRFSETAPPREAPQGLPYPLSKYPAMANPVREHHAVTFSFSDATAHETNTPSPISNPNPTPASTVPINSFADQVGYVPGINDATRLDHVGIFEPSHLRVFSDHSIETVGQFLALPSSPTRFPGIHVDQVDRWHAQIWLLWSVPGMRIDDARILVACGITEPQQLDTSLADQLAERIQRFLATTEGRHFAGDRDSISLDRINGWYRSLDATRPSWMNKNRVSPQDQGSPTEPSSTRGFPQIGLPRSVREPRLARPPRMSTPIPERKIAPRIAPAATRPEPRSRSKTKARTGIPKLKFFLDLDDHVEAAPSIGPKTAERFEKIGVVTVADFLKQTAESMATKINYKRISADAVQQWQQQARLICRIPNLRNHDAQLLVACNVWEPEDLASMQPKQLLDIIGPFSETKEGLKIIRNSKKPDLKEITDWINWANQMRSIQAA